VLGLPSRIAQTNKYMNLIACIVRSFLTETCRLRIVQNETTIRNGLLFQFAAGLSYGGSLGYALSRDSSIRALLELEGSPLQGELIAM
jgi:hypothetical protein